MLLGLSLTTAIFELPYQGSTVGFLVGGGIKNIVYGLDTKKKFKKIFNL